ncbi:DUF3823 domain-containing protein [Arcticibacter eurypsychrophilus]|uniref:DUF3823 domain-containing protein n=1 Tax=Arcticibacter eurypsychrophilus TaxID=1434752 RepID=UPI00084D54CD|nr:DUF3823 domain-containing protein [Arcticibacter eurypsychrophilus]
MKINPYKYILLFIIAVGGVGCEKDNYASPESLLTGKVIYEGQAIGVRSNGVQLELWQRGYAFFTKIPVFVNQDGSFSALLFDGNYKLTRQNGVGPWVNNTDSIDVKVSGNTMIDVPVTPYTFVKTATYQRNGTTMTATANLQTVSAANPLESVRLYVYRNALIDDLNQDGITVINASEITNVNQPLAISVTIPASLANADAVYVRIGVKTAGVAELAYSLAEKIQLK